MAQVQQTMPEVKLVIIGDGLLRYHLESLATNLLKRYRFLGIQSPEAVRKWMQSSSVLVAPSITTAQGETEGLPMVILEAMAMKLPVVSSIHAGIPEAIIDGKTGFLTQQKDEQALAQSMLRLLQNNQIREHFAESGRQQVEQRFDLKYNN